MNEQAESLSPKAYILAKIATVFEGVIFIISLLTLYTTFKYEILPLRFRCLLTGLLILINLTFFILIALGYHRKGYAKSSFVLTFLVLCVAGLGIYYLQSGVYTLNFIGTGADGYYRKSEFSILVLKDSPLQSIEELSGKHIGAPYALDQENIDKLYADLQKDDSIHFDLMETGSYQRAVNQLYEEEVEAIVFNKAYTPVIQEQHPQFLEETRALIEKNVEVLVSEDKKGLNTGTEPFIVYISGIDTSGPVDTTSRSDVNMLVSVNPTTKKIITLSVPRDSYVAIAGGGNNEMDKLTHAGLYGVESSRDTLANLFDLEIDYWVRVNFSSVIHIVDVLGGISIDNPTAFTGPGGHHFEVGPISLTGEQALSYSRERYSLGDGDIGRGKHQEIVLKGIINRLSGVEVLSNFYSILKVTEESMQTNMSTNEMMKLVNLQLEDSRPWDISSVSLSGSGQTGGLPSYAMPGWDLYMYVLDEESVVAAKQAIEAHMAGQ